MHEELLLIAAAVIKMEGSTTVTLTEGCKDIDQLIKIWQQIKSEAQDKLKLVIDHKISFLRDCTLPKSPSDDRDPYPKYRLLGTFIRLAKKLSEIGYQSNAVDDAVLEEVEAMVSKQGIGTPATTEVNHYPQNARNQELMQYTGWRRSAALKDWAANSFLLSFFGNNGCGWLPKVDGTGNMALVFEEDLGRYAVVPTNGSYPNPPRPDIHFHIDHARISTVIYAPEHDYVFLQYEHSSQVAFGLGFGSLRDAEAFVEHLKERPNADQMDVVLFTMYIPPHADDL